jgi:hypothetical protein
MARWTKQLIREQFAWTSKCFKQALLDLYGHKLTELEKSCDVPAILETLAVRRIYPQQDQQTNERYLTYITKLPTNQIELIIEAYSKGKFKRSPLTIDVLLSELLERATKFRNED